LTLKGVRNSRLTCKASKEKTGKRRGGRIKAKIIRRKRILRAFEKEARNRRKEEKA